MLTYTRFGPAEIGNSNGICFARGGNPDGTEDTCYNLAEHWFHVDGRTIGVCCKHARYARVLRFNYLGQSKEISSTPIGGVEK